MLAKGSQKESEYMYMNKQGIQFIQNILLLHEKYQYN